MLRKALWVGFASFALAAVACSSSTSDTGAPAPANNPEQNTGPLPPGPPAPFVTDDKTSIVIGVQDESFVGTVYSRLSSLVLKVTIDGAPAYEQKLTPSEMRAPPSEVTVHPPKGKSDAAIEVRLEGTFEDIPLRDGTPAQPGIVRLARTRFVPNEARVLPLRLEARCVDHPPMSAGGPPPITGPTCAAPLTCIGAKCASSDVRPDDMPAYGPEWWKKLPDKCRDAGAPKVQVGLGQAAFTPIATNDTLVPEAGPQCGHHVWLAIKATGLSQTETTTTVKSKLVETGEAGPDVQYAFSLGGLDAGGCALTGLRYQLDVAPGTFARFAGKELDLTVEVADTAGRKAQTTTRVRVADKASNPELPHCL